LSSHAIHVAPAGLAVSATNAALAHGAGISASILAMVKATVNSMLWSKAKKILAVGGLPFDDGLGFIPEAKRPRYSFRNRSSSSTEPVT